MRETETGQQVAQLHEILMMMMMMILAKCSVTTLLIPRLNYLPKN